MPRSTVIEQVNDMLSYLDETEPGLRTDLFHDAIAALGMRADVTLRLVPDSEADASLCSVAGVYLEDHEPPTLAVAESASPGRRAFTALHEFGHHLQRSVFELMDRLTQQPDGGIALEDVACDSFASAVLIPKELVVQHIGDRGPSAHSVVSLWEASNASRAAICVRTALELKTPGHVTLLDERGVVVFSSSRELPPLRRGGDQSNAGIVRAALRSSRRAAQGETDFVYRDGIRGQRLYAQAADIGGMLVVVSVTERATWLNLSLPKFDRGPTGAYRICEHPSCGHEFRSFESPCTECGAPKCPECGRCNCGFRLKEKTCPTCYLVKATHQFDPGSAECRDCA